MDNVTDTPNCKNDVTTISWGKGIVSKDLYQYHHVSRDIIVTDLFCDTPIIANYTNLCLTWKDGDSSLKDFEEVGARNCMFIHISYVMAVIWIIVVTIFH